jgi:hypothetical protein
MAVAFARVTAGSGVILSGLAATYAMWIAVMVIDRRFVCLVMAKDAVRRAGRALVAARPLEWQPDDRDHDGHDATKLQCHSAALHRVP